MRRAISEAQTHVASATCVLYFCRRAPQREAEPVRAKTAKNESAFRAKREKRFFSLFFAKDRTADLKNKGFLVVFSQRLREMRVFGGFCSFARVFWWFLKTHSLQPGAKNARFWWFLKTHSPQPGPGFLVVFARKTLYLQGKFLREAQKCKICDFAL